MRYPNFPPIAYFAALMLAPTWVYAHAEHDKVRYVAETGKDEGRCDQISAPCQTIAYAAKQAGKGDQIQMAEGRYEITDLDSIFYLSSNVVPVTGSYQKKTFQKPAAPATNSILVGVPAEFAQGLAEQGFQVISDTKGLNRSEQDYLNAKQSQLTAMASAQAEVPCVAGKAGEFSCNNLGLLTHVPLATLGNNNSRGNDIWGHFDLNDNREYALVGLTNGVSIVEVTDPVNPRVVSFIASQNTIWRDLATYQYYDDTRRRWMSYAYISADAASVGTMILDLNELPNKVTHVASETTDTSAHNIYISNVDYSTGVVLTKRTPYLHLAGSNRQGGAFNSYSLTNPLSPQAVYKHPANSRDWYSHDITSLWIMDARREQCIDKNNDCDLVIDYNENEVLLWDKTDSAKPFNLARSTYQYVSYVHSGWWTEDRQFYSVHDELDEQRYNLNTRVRFFELNNLRAPELVGEYIGPTPAVDHNGYTRGNRYYFSNYERGLVVLDISDPRNPVEAGFFDTYPIANSASFNGAWSTYPFLPSGNILIGDINSGLYVIRDNTAKAQGSVKFSSARVAAKEGEVLRVTLQRVGGSTGAVDVFYEAQPGNATAQDFTSIAGSISWLDGDASEKIIEIPIAADVSGNEFTETFFVRLYNPRNGLMLASPNLLVVDIADKPDEPVTVSSSSVNSSSSAAAVEPKKSGSGGGSAPLLILGLLGLLAVNTRYSFAVNAHGN
ncbi:choice-of-anchor B family protein [Cellvibrio sp. UBA7671]|uniref:choice-of-anchor B family protein n=1 Tax=Cellvibrio sp. UBA7671 TaxID=1946312 RepID=UPI002F35D5F6